MRLRRSDRRSDEAAALRRRALEFEANARVRDAIDVWTELNQLRPDVGIEEHLVDLRCGPVVSVGSGEAGSLPGARQYCEDPFPEVSGRPPEIDVEQLSAEILGGAIAFHGCVLVRGLFSRKRCDELRDATDREFAGRQQFLSGEPSARTTPWYVSCASWDAAAPSKAGALRLYNDNIGAVHVADSPRALRLVIGALQSAGVVEVVSEYLGEPAILSVQKTMLRRVSPRARPAWHQDGSFMGSSTRAVNAWVALSDCGEGTDAPGIAVLPQRLGGSIRGEVSGSDIVFSADELDTAGSGVEPVVPRFAPGDALLFDELLAHANGGGRPGLTRDRYALEAWMFAPRSAPEAYVPILL